MTNVNAVPFHERDYWESRFKKEKHFEWLLTWKDIQSEVETYLNKSEKILHLGKKKKLNKKRIVVFTAINRMW